MVGNKFLTLLSNMLTNINPTDVETGYKAFKAPLIKSIRIEEDGFGVEPEIIAKLARTGCRIYEVGISYRLTKNVEPISQAEPFLFFQQNCLRRDE
jgi:hypothetical protein